MKDDRHERARELLHVITEDTGAEYAARYETLVYMAKRYAHDEAARSIIDEAITAAERLRFPEEEAAIFRAVFIDRQMTKRKIAERHFMSVRTVYRMQRAFLERLMPLVFGIHGIPFE